MDSSSLEPGYLIPGAGFLGQALADSLRADGYHVTTADPVTGDIPVDVTHADEVVRLVSQCPSPERIIFCASTRGGSEEDFQRLYLDGVRLLLQAYPEVPLIFCSSTSVYGECEGSWVTEESPTCPVTKKSELLLLSERQVLNHGGCVVRLSSLYGPGRCELLSRYLAHGCALPGSMGRWLNYIHRDDAVRAIRIISDLSEFFPGIVNLSDGSPLQMKDVYQFLALKMNKPFPAESPRRGGTQRGITNQRISSDRLKQSAWTPVFPDIRDGLSFLLDTQGLDSSCR